MYFSNLFYIEGIYRLLLSDHAEPLNIGNPHEITIYYFAEEIMKFSGTKQKVVYKPLPVNDPMQQQLDNSKAKSILDRISSNAWFKSLPDERLYRKEHRDFVKFSRK